MKGIVFCFCVASMSAAYAHADTGVAVMKGTAEGSAISGTVSFQDVKGGVKVIARLSGVPAGQHGFHIHEFGSCEDSGKAAGGHYNPLGSHHGDVVKEGVKKAHAGDMGNITAGADGTASLELTIPRVSLTAGNYDVAGRAVILHEKADDMSQPAGNAGGRIGCGVIVIAPSEGARK